MAIDPCSVVPTTKLALELLLPVLLIIKALIIPLVILLSLLGSESFFLLLLLRSLRTLVIKGRGSAEYTPYSPGTGPSRLLAFSPIPGSSELIAKLLYRGGFQPVLYDLTSKFSSQIH